MVDTMEIPKDVSSAEKQTSTPVTVKENVKQMINDTDKKVEQSEDATDISKKVESLKMDNVKTFQKPSKNSKIGRASTKKLLEDKSLDYITKELSRLSCSEEKLSVLTTKYRELFNDYFGYMLNSKQTEKKLLAVVKEKESLQADYSKAVLHRSKLEDLSRELQRQNRAVKEESLLRVREVEEKRKEISSKFQTALNDISAVLQENQAQSTKLQEENMEMAKKLKVLYDQYHLREKHVEQLIQHREIETKLSETKIAKMQAEVTEDKECHMIEKKKLLEEVMALQEKCTEFATNELSVKAELQAYKDKYEEFQDNLKRNSSIFDRFKSEMNKMAKKIGKLEKETLEWQGKWKASNNTLISMAEDKQKSDQQLLLSTQKITKLENLCRALQHERNDLRASISKNQVSDQEINKDQENAMNIEHINPSLQTDESTNEHQKIVGCETTESVSSFMPDAIDTKKETLESV